EEIAADREGAEGPEEGEDHQARPDLLAAGGADRQADEREEDEGDQHRVEGLAEIVGAGVEPRGEVAEVRPEALAADLLVEAGDVVEEEEGEEEGPHGPGPGALPDGEEAGGRRERRELRVLPELRIAAV